jgi:F0F1-type ATP synthase assembly protein I
MNLIKKKEETAKKRYEEKIAKIESIQRRKALEKEERVNKSKSPSNYVTTTMSEFECTPYHGLSKGITIDKGFNSVQPASMMPSTSARSPKLPGTPILKD